MVAADIGLDRCVEILLDAGADPQLKNFEGKTAQALSESERNVDSTLHNFFRTRIPQMCKSPKVHT